MRNHLPEHLLDDEPLVLPAAWTAPSRPPLPIVASTVPIIGAVALWLVTGSVLALWLAALGPLIAIATTLDGARAARRDRRRAATEAERERSRISAAIADRHAAERARLEAQHPDVAAYAARSDDVWRPAPGRREALVAARGARPSHVRVSGGDGTPESRRLRAAAATLSGAPLVVPTASGVAVTGSAVVAVAVQRALVLQLCLTLPPGELRITGPAGEPWVERLPHGRATTGTALAVVSPGHPIPRDADIPIVVVPEGETVPPRCGTVLTVHDPAHARLADADGVRDVAVEALSRDQAEMLARELAERAERVPGFADAEDSAVALADLLARAPEPHRDGLAAVFAGSGRDPFVVDLVADGPHAVVAGVTGAGKSELLISWVLALCATHTTREVSFLLADFKGGTAFDALADVPHVTGVLSDLDGAGARRAIESLRAEVRWRESELARVGARDILDRRIELPRLVIVVDEFAALLGDHPELHAVFTDVAARGRALGMHLVLGTQRIAGVIRDSLIANCPLRLSLRVTDAADSRAVVGVDDAALLPGGASARGIALVRRAADTAPCRVRIALSTTADAQRIASAAADQPRPRRPWIPDLPARLSLEQLRRHGDLPRGGLLLGLADEPELQRQRPVALTPDDRGILFVGGPGSGKSNAVRLLASQAAGEVITVPADAEGAWDAVAVLSDGTVPAGALVVIDDLDALPGRFGVDYAHEVVDRLERVLRTAGDRGVVVIASAQRLTGPAGRLGELVARRVVLATASRADHLAAGGDPAHYAPHCPPGRGRLDGLAVQLCEAPATERPPRREPAVWAPGAGISGVVARRSAARDYAAVCAEAGVPVVTVDALAGGLADARAVAIGDPDDWQRQWRALASVRDEHTLVIDASCAAEFRVLTADRSLPPYVDVGRGRAWAIERAGAPTRVRVPRGAGQDAVS